MQNEMEIIQGTIENVVYCNAETGYTVIEVSQNAQLITAVGELGGVNEGEEVTLHGEYINHASFGRQFKVQICETRLPEDEKAVLKYLSSGALPYVGGATAKKIMELFGADTLDIIANEPTRLTKIKGITMAKAQKISDEFKRIFNVREAITWLSRYNVPATVAVEAYKIYGAYTIDLLSHNPYLMCAAPININFKTADAIAAELQIDEESDYRLTAAVLYILRHNLSNGHTCLPSQKLKETAAAFIGMDPEKIGRTMIRMSENSELSVCEISDKEYAYLPDYYEAETNIAVRLNALINLKSNDVASDATIKICELAAGIQYAPLQKEAISLALTKRAMVLTGGPGTGKTTTVNGIISCFEQAGERVFLAAPTGRAAKRLSELTGRKAQTIHRLLEVDFGKGKDVKFIHNENNTLKCDVLVVDEMSMVDVLLFDSLLRGLKPNCHIIMVGDEDQLPSVGAGSVLAGIVACEIVPVVRLKEIFRQASQSLIVSNAHRIVKGQPPVKGDKNSDWFMLEAKGEICAQLVCDLVCERLPSAYGYSAIQDIQVLCPTKLGILGTTALNPRLQALLNPPMPIKAQFTSQGRVFRVGDKVMQIKNDYDIEFRRDNGEDGVGAFNGDMGIIEEVNSKTGSVVVKSEDRRIIYTQGQLNELELAYAVTIHKSQGSEFLAVIMPIADVPYKLCYRNLLYTGVTRAKSLCIIAGQSEQVNKMAANAKSNLRYSCLKYFIQKPDAFI